MLMNSTTKYSLQGDPITEPYCAASEDDKVQIMELARAYLP